MADRVALLKLEIQGIKEVDELKDKLKSLKKGTDDYNSTLKQLNTTESQLSKTRSNLLKSTKDLIGDSKKGLTGVSDATGAATASALELGRVFSDAPYGIRGMANNISQLASQFSFMSNKVDAATGKVVGISGAFKQFGKAIKANAALLIIQALISAVDYFSNTVDKADKSLQKLAESGVNESITELTLLKKALEDNSKSLEEKEGLIKKAREEYDELNESLGDTPKSIATTLGALDLLILKYQDLARAKVLVELIGEEMKNQAKTTAQYSGSYTDMFNSFGSFISGVSSLATGKGLSGINTFLAKELSESQENIEKYEEMLSSPTKADPTKTYLELIYGKESKGAKKTSGRGISPFKTKKDLDIDIKTNENALLQYQKKIESQELKNAERVELLEANTEKEKEDIRRKYTSRRLENDIKYEEEKIKLNKKTELANIEEKTKNHIASLEMAYDEFVVKLDYQKKLGKINQQQYDELFQDASLKLGEAVMNADAEETKSIKEVETKYKGLFKVFYELAEERRDALGIGESKDSLKDSLKKYDEYAKQLQKVLGSINDFLDSEFERQLTMEQNKTNALNNELHQRLLNEKLSKDERKAIQNEIAQNDEKLRIKQQAIEKKKFKQQKAFNIAIATIDTFRAAAGVLADTKGGSFARIAGMVAVISSGLLQVAAISRQKFQSSSASSPVRGGASGAGGDGVGDRSFNFNLVGNTLGNQITDAIQGQFDQPLKAYVVSRDITSQQALDANIKGTASF